MNKEGKSLKLNRDIFTRLELGLLYLYTLVFFINYDISKALLTPMILILIGRKVIYKEKLNCGSEKLKKFLLFFLIGGCVWSFMAAFNYRDSRAFLKASREILLPFYIYPLFVRDRDLLKKIVGLMIPGFLLMAGKTLHYAIAHTGKNAFGFEGVSITRIMGMTGVTLSFGFLASKQEKKWGYIIGGLFFLLSFGVVILSQSRAGMVAIAGAMAVTILLQRINLKTLAAILISGSLLLMAAPDKVTDRFNNIFNTEMTKSNFSNYARVEMWKNALWRIKQHPLRGGGIKSDQELFEEYANNMPESTEIERFFKKRIVDGGFNDAHNMYLNILTAHGIFSIVHLILLFGIIPTLIIRNLRDERLDYFEKSLNLGIGTTIVSFYIYGLFWSIWRGNWSRMEFWFLVALLCCITFKKDRIESSKY